MNDLLNVNIAINGKTQIVITADSDLGREVLKTIKPGSCKVEVTSDITQIMGKPVPTGSIIITNEE